MLTKMPIEKESKTETAHVNTKFFVGVVVLFAFLGLAGGYIIFPLLQSPNELTLTSNLTNNNTTANNTGAVVKHTTKYTNTSVQSTQNTTDKTKTKTPTNTNTSTQSNSVKVVQTSKNNNNQ